MKSPFHLAVGFLAASLCFAQTGAEKKPAPAKARSAKAHVVVSPDSLKWGPPPEGMVEGSLPAEFANEPPAQFAVVGGDPLKPGAPYILRIKTAPGSRIAPHRHPGDEHATVLKGTIGLGLGNKFDKAALHELSAGSYSLMPARTTHFGWSKDEAIVQVHGIGPFKVVWVSPAAAAPAKGKSSKPGN